MTNLYTLALAAALVAGTAGPAFADSHSEAVYYADLSAFESTDAFGGSACQEMLHSVDASGRGPSLLQSPSFVANGLISMSSQCLRGVRSQTDDRMPAQIPSAINAMSCARFRALWPQLVATYLQLGDCPKR